jgi:hypothetical protein
LRRGRTDRITDASVVARSVGPFTWRTTLVAVQLGMQRAPPREFLPQAPPARGKPLIARQNAVVMHASVSLIGREYPKDERQGDAPTAMPLFLDIAVRWPAAAGCGGVWLNRGDRLR